MFHTHTLIQWLQTYTCIAIWEAVSSNTCFKRMHSFPLNSLSPLLTTFGCLGHRAWREMEMSPGLLQLGRHVPHKMSLNKPVKIHFRWKLMKTMVSLQRSTKLLNPRQERCLNQGPWVTRHPGGFCCPSPIFPSSGKSIQTFFGPRTEYQSPGPSLHCILLAQ